MPYKHIFFDLDDTIWDFDRNSDETLKEIVDDFELEKKGIPNHDAFIIEYKARNSHLWKLYRENKIAKSLLREQRFVITLEKFGIEDQKLSSAISEDYLVRCPFKTHLIPHALEMLNYLNKKYALHVITNGFEEVQHKKIDNAEIRHFFTSIIISEEVGYQKPDKRIFEFALENACSDANEVVMIGDNYEADIIGARQAGIDQIYFNRSGQLNGEEATHVIQSLKELEELL